jgi:hypothetical protein
MEGSGHGLTSDTVPEFSWRDESTFRMVELPV